MRAYTSKLTVLGTIILLLSSCGGGATGSSVATPAATTPFAGVVAAMNTPTERTPAGFYSPSQGSTERRDYMHVRSDQVMAGVAVSYEVSSSDPNQAYLWSADVASRSSQNMKLVASDETEWFYEYSWSPENPQPHQSEVLSVRVLKSSAIDRSVYDRNNPSSLLAVIQHRPITGADARFVAEYLWTFSMSNNAGHIVLDSDDTIATTTGVRHTVTEAVFDPAMNYNTCSPVQIINSHYDVNSVNGGVELSQSLSGQFQVRLNPESGYTICN